MNRREMVRFVIMLFQAAGLLGFLYFAGRIPILAFASLTTFVALFLFELPMSATIHVKEEPDYENWPLYKLREMVDKLWKEAQPLAHSDPQRYYALIDLRRTLAEIASDKAREAVEAYRARNT